MRKNKRNLIKALCIGLAGSMLIAPLASCRPTVPDTEQTLEVFCWKGGYGADWCEMLLDAFEQQDWVKEKYPQLKIVYEANADRSAVGTRLGAGEGRNTIDMVFSDGLDGVIGVDNIGNEYSCELTDVVYNTMVPGEDVKVIDKLTDDYRKAVMYYKYGESAADQTLAFKAYDFFWASGMMGMVYNEELLSSFGYATAPRTSDEFIEACAKISADTSKEYGKKYAIMWSGGADYSQYLYDIWWGQYEGHENYYNYWNGISFDGEDYTEKSSDIFKQIGRRESMATMIDVFANTNGYCYDKGASADYKAAQRYYILGEGVFMFNGDWFAKENEALLEKSQYTFKMMKTPIISSIIDKTPTINSEEALREVVSKIDAGYATAAEAGLSGVSETDYAKIIEARSITYSLGPGCKTCIPNYAKGKEIAFDFLRFMATDKAQEIYAEATHGASLPFKYDLKNNMTLYNSLSDLQKSRYEMFYESVHGSKVLPYGANYPLAKFGGLSQWTTFGLNGLIMSAAMNGTKTGDASAQAIYDRDVDYWTNNNSQKWYECLRLAGLNN